VTSFDILLLWCVAVKLAVWEALLAQYVDSIEWVLQVLSMHQFSCNFVVVVVDSVVILVFVVW